MRESRPWRTGSMTSQRVLKTDVAATEAWPGDHTPAFCAAAPAALNRVFTLTRKKWERGQPSGVPPRPVAGYRAPIRGIGPVREPGCGWMDARGAGACEGHRPEGAGGRAIGGPHPG